MNFLPHLFWPVFKCNKVRHSLNNLKFSSGVGRLYGIKGVTNMSTIDRYKKKGGFLQLLNLIETCGTQKQEKFLKMIDEEDMNWGEAVKVKMLSIKKIFSWDDNTLAEIAGTLNDMTISVSSFGLDQEQKEKIFKTLNHSRKRKINEDIAERKPDAAEISTAYIQIITHVRKMIADGFLILDKIDPDLTVNSEFEDRLLKGGGVAPSKSKTSTTAMPKETTLDVTAVHDSKDLDNMRKKLFELKGENDALREKLTQYESKLAQIRKIA